MRGATRSRHTIHHVWTHFQVLHPSRSAHTHTTRSRDASRTTAYSEPRQTSPSTMLIPTRTARSFECRGASSLSLRGFGLTTRRRAQQRALASTAPAIKAAHIGPYECTHVRTRTRTGVRSPARSGVGVRGRAVPAQCVRQIFEMRCPTINRTGGSGGSSPRPPEARNFCYGYLVAHRRVYFRA
jgi:hypothetical protein